MDVILDINSEIYPMKIADKFTLTLSSSLLLSDSTGSKAADAKREIWRDLSTQKTLADDYDYVMFGKVYKYDEGAGKSKV
jgi:DNA-directed RNA polymerases I, II, and III subunit RPABC3